jgi:hypothetical protein
MKCNWNSATRRNQKRYARCLGCAHDRPKVVLRKDSFDSYNIWFVTVDPRFNLGFEQY